MEKPGDLLARKHLHLPTLGLLHYVNFEKGLADLVPSLQELLHAIALDPEQAGGLTEVHQVAGHLLTEDRRHLIRIQQDRHETQSGINTLDLGQAAGQQ